MKVSIGSNILLPVPAMWEPLHISVLEMFLWINYFSLFISNYLLIPDFFASEYTKIVHKKTDEWYIEWQQVATSGTTSDNEWQRVVQRVTANDNEWEQVAQRMTTSNNEWYNEWQRMAISAKFSFFQIREEIATKHPKENSLKRTFEEGLLN